MQFSDLALRSAAIASQVAKTLDVQPASDWRSLVNKGYADLGWETDLYEGLYTTFAVVGQAAYPLPPPDWKYLFDVLYGAATPGIPLKHSSEGYERRIDPLFLIRPPATPARFYFKPGFAVLVPTPADNSEIWINGIQVPPALVADYDLPISPSKYDEAICARAAWFHLVPLALADPEAVGPALVNLEQYFTREVGKLRNYLAAENSWREPRRVARAVMPRISLDGTQ